jgi:hypothetical protein
VPKKMVAPKMRSKVPTRRLYSVPPRCKPKVSSISPALRNRTTGLFCWTLLMWQEITEAVVTASLDVDSVLPEIGNEHARLMEVRSVLDARRNRAVGLVSTGNLIIGTDLDIAVNALQFKIQRHFLVMALESASGVASTVLRRSASAYRMGLSTP